MLPDFQSNRLAGLLDRALNNPQHEIGIATQRGGKGASAHSRSQASGLWEELTSACPDAAALDRLVRRIRRELIDDAVATGAVPMLLIDGIAADFTELFRARVMLELFQRPDV